AALLVSLIDHRLLPYTTLFRSVGDQTEDAGGGVPGGPCGGDRVGEEHQPDRREPHDRPGPEHGTGGRGGRRSHRVIVHPHVVVHPRAVSARNRQTAPSTKIANQTSTFSTQTTWPASPVSG